MNIEITRKLRMIPLVPQTSPINTSNLDSADIIITSREYANVNLNVYKTYELYKDPVCIIGSKKNPVFQEEKLDLAKLADFQLLMLKDTASTHGFVPATFQRLESEIPNFASLCKNAIQLDPTELYYILKSGSSWSVFCQSLAAEYAHDCKIIPLEEGPGSKVSIVMAYKSNNPNPAIKLFEKTLMKVLQTHTK